MNQQTDAAQKESVMVLVSVAVFLWVFDTSEDHGSLSLFFFYKQFKVSIPGSRDLSRMVLSFYRCIHPETKVEQIIHDVHSPNNGFR